MSAMQFFTKLADDKNHVVVELHMDGKPLGHAILAPSEAENHMRAVAKTREQCTEEVYRDLDPNARMEAVVDPVWRTSVQHSMSDFGIALSLRHPGYGWLAFLIPHHEAATLGQWLIDNVRKPGQPTPPPAA